MIDSSGASIFEKVVDMTGEAFSKFGNLFRSSEGIKIKSERKPPLHEKKPSSLFEHMNLMSRGTL